MWCRGVRLEQTQIGERTDIVQRRKDIELGTGTVGEGTLVINRLIADGCFRTDGDGSIVVERAGVNKEARVARAVDADLAARIVVECELTPQAPISDISIAAQGDGSCIREGAKFVTQTGNVTTVNANFAAIIIERGGAVQTPIADSSRTAQRDLASIGKRTNVVAQTVSVECTPNIIHSDLSAVAERAIVVQTCATPAYSSTDKHLTGIGEVCIKTIINTVRVVGIGDIVHMDFTVRLVVHRSGIVVQTMLAAQHIFPDFDQTCIG